MNPEGQKAMGAVWTRKMARAVNWLQGQEAQLDKMKAKGINPDFIAAKSAELDDIIDVINTADELIRAYRQEIISLRLEAHILTKQLSEAQINHLIHQPNAQLFHEIIPKSKQT